MGLYRDETGTIIELDDRFADARGYAPVSAIDENRLYAERGLAARADEGAGGMFNAGISRLASGASLGLSDVLKGAVMTPGEREQLTRDIEAHPYVSTAAELTGSLVGAFAAPGSALAKTPAGYLSALAGREVAEGLAAGGVRGTAKALGAMGAEGAIQSAGQYIGHSALEDKETTAEGLAGSLGTGFAFGAVGGGAVLGVAKGAMAGRRMWSRVMDGPQAAKQAESAWSLASQEALDSDLATARVAETKLDEIRKSKMEAMRYRNETGSRLREERIATQGMPERPVPETGMPMPTSGIADELPLDHGIAPAKGGQVTSAHRVEWTPEGTKKIQRPEGAKPPAEAPTELESQLAGTKTQLDTGTPLKDIKAAKGNEGDTSINTWLAEKKAFDDVAGDPNKTKPIPRPDLQANRQATLAEIRYKATEDLLGPAMAKEEQRLTDVMDEFSAARKDVEHLFGHGDISDGVPEHLGGPTQPSKGASTGRASPGKRRAVEILDDAHEEALLRAKHAADPREAGQAITEAADLEKLIDDISDGVPRMVDGSTSERMGEQLLDEIKKLWRYEEASAKLADALGDQAHLTSSLRAKGFRDAEKDSMRKVMDRSSRAVDDAETFGPTYASPKERVQYARSRQSDAQAQLDEIGVQEKEATHAFNKATKAVRDGEKAKKAALSTDAAAARVGAQDIGGAFEIMDLPGIPKPSDLPIIGPLIGAYLKFRTLKRAMGGRAGRVPATADNRVAALASRTRDRVARAVDRSLGILERGGKFAARVIPPSTGALAHRIFDDGDEDPGKDAPITKQAAARMREISAYVHTPGAIEKDVRRQLRDVVDPDVIAAAEKHRRVMMEHLLKHTMKMPEQGIIKTVNAEPSPAVAMSFARRLDAANDPASVFERLAQEQTLLSLEAAEVMREVYPQLLKQAAQRAVERASEPGVKVPLRQRIQMSLFYKLPFDSALDPVNFQITQSVYDRKPTAPVGGMPGVPLPAPQSSVAQPTNIAPSYTPTMDRR